MKRELGVFAALGIGVIVIVLVVPVIIGLQIRLLKEAPYGY